MQIKGGEMNWILWKSSLRRCQRATRITFAVFMSAALTCAAAQTATLTNGSTRSNKADANSETATAGTSAGPGMLPDAPAPTLTNRTEDELHAPAGPASHSAVTAEPAPVTLGGIHATLSLVSEVSSKLASGSSFRARLEEPVAKDGQTVLPKGTVFEGHLRTIPARRPMRAGSVFMMFDRAILPAGSAETIVANVTGTNSNAVKTDPEGQMRPTISKKRLVIQLGGTALTAKLADDLSQVIGGTAVSASTARYVGFGAATTFFLIQKGREVKLKPGDQVEVEFGR
jgi:hypothetical protein